MAGDKIYIICAHIGDLTVPQEAWISEDLARLRLHELRQSNLEEVKYSLQYVILKEDMPCQTSLRI